MKMYNQKNKGAILSSIQKSSSCEELSFKAPTNNDASGTQSSCRCSFKSMDDLPSSVAECFQDSTLINKIQNTLLLFIGRGSRYKIVNTTSCSFLSLLNQRKNELESNSVLVLNTQKDEPKVKRKEPLKHVNSLPVRPKTTSPPADEKHNNIIVKSGEDHDEGERYTYIYGEDRYRTKDDSLLRQYLTLQQLAISRRHCSQLRRIRDSLLNGKACCTSSIRRVPTKEQEELRNFLMDVGFVQYYALLNRHGYDFETASHMNAFDLAAVGIAEPLHRMALKYELDQVRRPIQPLESIPETVDEWLDSLSLSEYNEHFKVNSIYCPLAAVGLTKRDLQLMGIYLLGHRKKLVLALSAIGLTITGGKNTKKHQERGRVS
ncbi:UNVERIFIED_CONTAM: hypothetical protein RMT77_001576 [Armadillidium vulgare]